MVKVSVILPVYNVEKYLKECLDSIINQTLKDIEILCINDGSTDNSLAILETYAKNDDRIIVISKENEGAGAARNTGLKNSSGQFVSFVDSDDVLKLDMLEELYINALSNQSDLVIFKIARFNEDPSELDYSIPGFDLDNVFNNVDFNNFTFDYHDIKRYVLNASFAPWTKLYNREFLLNNNIVFDEKIVFEDVLFHIELLLTANKISFSPNFYYYYRHNPNSLVNTSKNGFDIFKVIDVVENYLKDNQYYGEFKNEFDFFKIVQILNYMLSTQSDDYFQKAKEEFSKMKLSSNHMIDNYFIERFELVLNTNSLYEYIEGHYEISLTNLNGIISALNSDIIDLKYDNENLNRIREKMIENKILLLAKNEELKFEIGCVTKNNVKLTKKNSKLTKMNKKLKFSNNKLKKTNNLVLNSTSWRITKPLRSFTNLFRK